MTQKKYRDGQSLDFVWHNSGFHTQVSTHHDPSHTSVISVIKQQNKAPLWNCEILPQGPTAFFPHEMPHPPEVEKDFSRAAINIWHRCCVDILKLPCLDMTCHRVARGPLQWDIFPFLSLHFFTCQVRLFSGRGPSKGAYNLSAWWLQFEHTQQIQKAKSFSSFPF